MVPYLALLPILVFSLLNASAAVGACVACELADSDVQSLYSEKEWKELKAGKIQIANLTPHVDGESSIDENLGSILIQSSAAQVWAVLTDFEKWPDFMPLITETQITRRKGLRWWVKQQFEVFFVSMGHTTIYDLSPQTGRLAWSLDLNEPHDIEASQGNWQLLPLNNGHSTLVRYHAFMNAGQMLPEFAKNFLRRKSLEKLIGNLRSETNRRYGVTDK